MMIILLTQKTTIAIWILSLHDALPICIQLVSATGTRDERPVKTYRKVRNLRYLILGWLLIAGLLNYMDRSSISIAAPFMMEDLGLSNTDIGLMGAVFSWTRSEEHTSELQSRGHLVCRLLLE